MTMPVKLRCDKCRQWFETAAPAGWRCPSCFPVAAAPPPEDVEWHYMLAEASYAGFLLRVQSTTSPRRWHWYVTPLSETKKPFRDSRQMSAKAHGFSGSFEAAQKDAVAMADAILKEEASK